MKQRALQMAALALILWGMGQMTRAAYIHSKASLAQVLIRRAWAKASKKGDLPKPWPWADTAPVARLISRTHDVDLVVLAGSSGRTLAFGPGHITGTALPGSHGNSAIGGHRDTHFHFLRDVARQPPPPRRMTPRRLPPLRPGQPRNPPGPGPRPEPSRLGSDDPPAPGGSFRFLTLYTGIRRGMFSVRTV